MARIGFLRSSRWWATAVTAAVGLALAIPSAGLGVVQIDEIHDGLADYDSRDGSAEPTGFQLAAASRIGAQASWNHLGTPQSLFRRGGVLAKGVRGSTAGAAARAWIDANRSLFRLSSRGLRIERTAALGRGRVVIFRQSFGGLRGSPDGVAVVALLRAGRGWNVVYASSSLASNTQLRGAFRLSREQALIRAFRNVGKRLSPAALGAIASRSGWSYARADGIDGRLGVRPVAFPTRNGAVRAWETFVTDFRDGEAIGYGHVIDGRTGRVLLRTNLVDHSIENPRWAVFPGYPHSALDEFPWNYPSADIRDLWCWFREDHCQYLPSTSLGDHEVEWDKDARTDTPTFTTTGNNARSAEAWFSPFFPGPTGYMPVSPTRDYVYPWENLWFETLCDPANFAVPGVGNDISASVVNLFKGHNRMHDWSYVLGFREGTWNAQDYNFGINPAGERDPIEGIVQAGGASGGYPNYSGRDNAFMRTLPDGTRSQSGMFLWQPLAGSFYAPCVDGDFDMSVIGHEYGHMIENRMIGKGNRRMGVHAGMMGESHGDLLGMEYVNEYRFHPEGNGGDNPVADATMSVVGTYVTGNDDRGIRNYDMAFPSAGHYPQPGLYPFVNPLNFSDVGYDITGPQVHADGEIWSATNFDIRELLLNRYPSLGERIQRECADGIRPVYDCPGNRRWVQLLFDAFLLMPVRPTFLDARNAILAADVVRFGGANQDLLWLGFARRGFGQNAVNKSSEDFRPIPDFESPLHEEETIVFNAFALNEGNAPITNAKVFVGHYEARVTEIADTNPATVGHNLDNVARFVPEDTAHTNARHRAYDFVIQAEGYGHVRFRVTEIKPGETRVVNVYMPTNWASRHKGAVATGEGVRHDHLIDDTENTNWEFTGGPVQGRQVLVKLGGVAQHVDRVNVSALLVPDTNPDESTRATQNRFTALREFEVYGCRVARNGDVEIDGVTYGCQRIVKSQWDAFPGVPPRPVGPDLVLRTWDAGGGQAVTHVLFRVLNNQCTGQPAFHGEQDNDPANTSTDCRIGTLPTLPPRSTAVRAAELQVFSDQPRVDGAQSPE